MEAADLRSESSRATTLLQQRCRLPESIEVLLRSTVCNIGTTASAAAHS